MPEENQNSWEQVAGKLGGLEHLPGETPVDFAGAWNGIQSRVNPGGSYRALWWSAAAVLFLSFGTLGILRLHAPDRPGPGKAGGGLALKQPERPNAAGASGMREPVKKEDGQPGTGVGPEEVTATAAKKNCLITPHRRRVRERNTMGKEKKAAFAAEVRNAAGAGSIQQTKPSPENSFAPLVTDSVARPTVATKKAPRVVYLNELETPGQQSAEENPLDNGLLTARRHVPLRSKGLAVPATSRPQEVFPPSTLFKISLNGSE